MPFAVWKRLHETSTNADKSAARGRPRGKRYHSGMSEPGEDREAGLSGLRVLIVEDETLVAMLVEEYLSELGCIVAGSVRRVDKALERIDAGGFDAAVLDQNVAGDDVTPVAEALDALKIPFVFASGYGGNGLKEKWADRPVIQKPFTSSELKKALLQAIYPNGL